MNVQSGLDFFVKFTISATTELEEQSAATKTIETLCNPIQNLRIN